TTTGVQAQDRERMFLTFGHLARIRAVTEIEDTENLPIGWTCFAVVIPRWNFDSSRRHGFKNLNFFDSQRPDWGRDFVLFGTNSFCSTTIFWEIRKEDARFRRRKTWFFFHGACCIASIS